MKHLYTISFILFSALILLVACNYGHDPKLETADTDDGGMIHGYNLTELGSMVYSPWQFDLRPTNDSLYNVRVLLNDSEISSKGFTYTPQEADLVFEPQKNMTMKYWFKSDYIHSPIDTASDGGIIKHGVSIDNTNIKNIYIGQWIMNTRDSSFKFLFNDDKMPLPSIEGKYMDLGSSSLSYQVTSFFDSTLSGKTLTLKKIVTKYFTH